LLLIQTAKKTYNSHKVSMPMHPNRRTLALSLAALLWSGSALAQQNPNPSPANDDSQPADVGKTLPPGQTPAETTKWCWQSLTDSVKNSKRTNVQAQALNALSSLGANPRALGLIAEAMKDENMDVRTAAILAAGKTKSATLVEPVKRLLNDPEPQVVFAAATTLWKQFKDKSGEDVLAAIAAGDRKANPTLIHGAMHDVSRTLHSPSALTRIGIETSAGLLLGPFGFSVGAVEYARRNGSDSSRVQSIDLLADERSEGVHDQMKSELDDKDPGVRAAAVMVLGNFHRPKDAAAIAMLLNDSKLPVRLAAAAAYVASSTPAMRAKIQHS
jgi:HEAT repeat protein